MSARAYTVAEIDALRAAVSNKWLWGSVAGGLGGSRSYYANEKEVAVEERVRTYMMAGVTADDLIAAEKAQREEWSRMSRQWDDEQAVYDIIRKNAE